MESDANEAVESPTSVLSVSRAPAPRSPWPSPEDAPTIVIVVTFGSVDVADFIPAGATHVAHIAVGDVLGASSTPSWFDGEYVQTQITHPTDLTAIGQAINDVCSRWGDLDAPTVCWFDSLDAALASSAPKDVFRFVHLLIGRLESVEASVYVHLDSSGVPDATVGKFARLFEHVRDERSSDRLPEATDDEVARLFGD